MKTPEEIKMALNVCCNGIKLCQAFNGETCPYLDDSDCLFSVNRDALEYIEQLEERIARKNRKNEEKQGYIEQLEERITIMKKGRSTERG